MSLERVYEVMIQSKPKRLQRLHLANDIRMIPSHSIRISIHQTASGNVLKNGQNDADVAFFVTKAGLSQLEFPLL